MPELPEVETVKRGLSELIVGKKIIMETHDWPKGFPNAQADVDSYMLGAHVKSIARRAKVLMIHLDTNYSLVVHLKMTGQLVYVPKQNSESRIQNSEERFGAGHPNDSLIGRLPDKSTRVQITFADGSHLFFNDQRKFGWIKLVPTVEIPQISFFKTVGPEPLNNDEVEPEFLKRIRRRKKSSIKAAIMDQTVVAGVGNIYADESLWMSKIHPATHVEKVSDRKLKELLKNIQIVLQLSIDKGGSTDRNYVDAKGNKGSYLEFAKVFRREGQPCPRCGTTIEKTKVATRGTHFCPKCQK